MEMQLKGRNANERFKWRQQFSSTNWTVVVTRLLLRDFAYQEGKDVMGKRFKTEAISPQRFSVLGWRLRRASKYRQPWLPLPMPML
jgi:hypothetical protein